MPRIFVLVVTAAVSLGLSYTLYTALVWAVDQLWRAGDGSLWGQGPPSWFVLLLPALAGAAVVAMRSRWANGHGPLAGLQLGAVAGSDFPSLLGAIVVTMLCGVALGPEAALLTTGGVVGGVAAARYGVEESIAVGWAGLWAVAALFLGPFLSGSFDVSGPGYEFAWVDAAIAVASAIVAVAVLSVVRRAAVVLQVLQPAGRCCGWRWAAGCSSG